MNHYECNNCNGRWADVEELDPVADVFQRVAPGEAMPAGQCPTCGALVHLEPVGLVELERIERGDAAVEAYVSALSNTAQMLSNTAQMLSRQEIYTDLLADLLHAAANEDLAVRDLLASAVNHYEEETNQ